MSAERCRVCVYLNNATQFYQRDREEKRDGQWVAIPYFVLARNEATTMGEASARTLVAKIRGLGWRGEIWLETPDGRRIDVGSGEAQPKDTREPVAASLDEIDWYVVRPANTPNGPRWFIKVQLPDRPEETIFEADPLAVLAKASELGWLRFVEKYQRPQLQPQQPSNPGPRVRPGALR